ncbi:MAG: M20 family metallopeptidase [Acidobacteriaceae bacterium]|nr:M20 family metallopeptidase [Acidobacteriaceae bacterium]
MKTLSLDTARRILCDLIEIRTVNPMGNGYTRAETVECEALDYIDALFKPYSVPTARHRCSPIHENLLITIPGKNASDLTLLESHVDTVPADDWPETAFVPRSDGCLVYGRGACDDKGSLTSMILAVLDLLESGTVPPHPVALLAAGDEEYAQTGIKFFAGLDYPIGRAIVGEPTGLSPILQHKGTVRWDITVHGRSAHTARPELGSNAIAGAVRAISLIGQHEEHLRGNFLNPLTKPPTITVTMIHGGRTRNAVPDECTFSVDFRVVPGMDPAAARQTLIDRLANTDLQLTHREAQLVTPPLNSPREHPFNQAVLRICRSATGMSEMEFAGAPYGTDAAWVADRGPAVVLGPGSIEFAHAVDERVPLDEVVKCAAVYRDILITEF